MSDTGDLYSNSENGDNPRPDERATQMGEGQGADLTHLGEIEVTQEMIDAGAHAGLMSGWNPDEDPYSELAEIIYRSMIDARIRANRINR